jgi:hypothetical protein
MSGQFFLHPGQMPAHPGPLARFLPPIFEGQAASWLKTNIPPGAWVLDPFGTLPRLAVEAARAGYRVLATANNPIERFLLELAANPPPASELRAALADLAAAQKGSERIEPHLRSLYRTECAQCGLAVEAQAFIWDRETNTPVARIYTCPYCHDQGERPGTAFDIEQAAKFGSGGINRLRALERVAPLNDPDRGLAEEALDAYPPRAVYALFTLINKLESFSPARQHHLCALLLPVLDHSNVLWGYPNPRPRPRLMGTPARYREVNIWLALEYALEAWEKQSPRHLASIPLTSWPDAPPESGGVCLFKGPLRELTDQISVTLQSEFSFQAVISALPRPNQAYWTLSALWAGWLWGSAATAHFKSVLRRRRYDWAWHASALHAALKNLGSMLPHSIPFLGLIGESEPGFLAAALTAAELAGFHLDSLAMRSELGQAQIQWTIASRPEAFPAGATPASKIAQQAVQEHLQARLEPVNFNQFHAAALVGLVQTHAIQTAPQLAATEALSQTQEAIQTAAANRNIFTRLAGSERTPESGFWQLAAPPVIGGDLPLSDQVEIALIRVLQNHPNFDFSEIDNALCRQFSGLFTPELDYVQACLSSYGEPISPGSMQWKLRPQDTTQARRSDIENIAQLLSQIGENLGFTVTRQEVSTSSGMPSRSPILWTTSQNKTDYIFYVIASAVISNIIFQPQTLASRKPDWSEDQPPRQVIIVPGGRAGLLALKLHRNPGLQRAVQASWRITKFRHIRRLASTQLLTRSNLDRQLAQDPLANTDPQMTLL